MNVKTAIKAALPRTTRNWLERRYFLRYGEIEMNLVDVLCDPYRDSIDVGANHGGYVHFMLPRSLRTLAFEPIPEYAAILRDKFPDAIVQQIALSNASGMFDLCMPVMDGNAIGGCSTLSADAVQTFEDVRALSVQIEPLDVIYRGVAGFIKIDVEGHELAVLEGASKTISVCKPRILIEIDERLSPNGIAKAMSFFEEIDYHGYFIHDLRLFPIEEFDRSMQNPSKVVDLTATLKGQGGVGAEYVNNFIFIHDKEGPALLGKMVSSLKRLEARC